MADLLNTPMTVIYRKAVGYREDLHLNQKWWHRLLKVAYVVIGLVVAGLALYMGSEATPDSKVKNVRIIRTLMDLFQSEKDPSRNLALALSAEPGTLGLIQADGSIDYVSETYFKDSFCTIDAVAAAADVAGYLNKQNFTQANTASTILASAKESKTSRLCWFDDNVSYQLQNASWDNVVKYEFTQDARLNAPIAGVLQAVAILIGVHLLLATLYYRGFVYIVCGPRQRKIKPQGVA